LLISDFPLQRTGLRDGILVEIRNQKSEIGNEFGW
jgi:hypothetical protein